MQLTKRSRLAMKNTGSMSCNLSRQIYFARIVPRHSHNAPKKWTSLEIGPGIEGGGKKVGR